MSEENDTIIRVRIQKAVIGLLSALILLPAWSCAAASSASIETVGTGRSDPKLTNATQRRSTACEAATIEAQAKMLSILGQTSTLKGAEIVRTQWLADDRCRVTLRLDKN